MSGLLQNKMMPKMTSHGPDSFTPHRPTKVGNKVVSAVQPHRQSQPVNRPAVMPPVTDKVSPDTGVMPPVNVGEPVTRPPMSDLDPVYTQPVEPLPRPIDDRPGIPVTKPTPYPPTQPTPGTIVNDGGPQLPDSPGTRPAVDAFGLGENATVAGQLQGLLAEDSAYLQQARQQAAEQAAARGLRNSTMGVQAGEQAAIAQALPIAQQDAQQHFQLQQNQQLQGYQLEQAQFAAQLQSVLANEQHQFALEQMDTSQRHNLETMNQEFVNTLERMGVEMGHQARMAYTQSSTVVMQTAMEQLGFIYSNPEMTPEQQQQAVQTVMSNLQQQFSFLQNIFAPFPGLDFAPPSAQPNPSQPPPPDYHTPPPVVPPGVHSLPVYGQPVEHPLQGGIQR